jgi:peptidoglycan/LPS O-acetylase OafA/YrhL
MRYVPALDGLRALAVLAVVAFHARVPGFGGGFIGVDLFFVLSGYLITQVLAENPSLPRFYWRRARRLIPAFSLMLVAYMAVYPLVRPSYPHWRDALLAFFYLSDYSFYFAGIPDFIRNTWSLAVEEHFYLVWPAIFIAWRPRVQWLLVAFVIATLWRAASLDWVGAYHRFDTHASGLILGCAIASVRRVDFPAWPGLLILAVCTALFQWKMPLVQYIGFTVAEVGAMIAIIGRPPGWLSHPALAYVGKLSYGIYLWHYPIMRITRDSGEPWQLTLSVSLGLSVIAAAISYHTVEAAFRSRHNQAICERPIGV